MLVDILHRHSRALKFNAPSMACLLVLLISDVEFSQQQPDSPPVRAEPFYIDLHHRFDSKSDFVPRGSVLVRPATEHRPAQANFVQQYELSEADLKALTAASAQYETYYLKAAYRRKKTDTPTRITQTSLKSCSLHSSSLTDYLVINLNPLNEFVSVNLFTDDPECKGPAPVERLPQSFNTTILLESGFRGPQPDTATYIRRLEEERQNKLKEGKEDNRSFLAKYWIYIVPGVVILMMLGGPEQGAR